ncbi:M23 family metallopeptidase [Tetragenococcus koreensis]|uniref:M23 family metallopeptidase n=1 Tax=Tetragenococcus koreensis TaxID=290335 RepID=UPI001D03EDD8|nr:M23 family metallopeptidase [Tetragenococcus koreensis]
MDFAAAKGTPIKAAKSGKVIQSEYHPSWGNYVAIKHSDGLTTLYAHCSRNIAKVGQTVKQGQTIALLGSTGNSTGPHLHFEVNRSQNLEQKQLMNPLQVLKE